jgi:NTP pyrophosphatase (non-canonical NTP hydrolase)
MELKKLQSDISKIFLKNAKRDNLKVDEDYLVMKISEELGEFVQSYLVHKKRCRPAKYLAPKDSHREMSKELSDVVGLAFVLSKALKIDLEEALVKKWITREWLKK